MSLLGDLFDKARTFLTRTPVASAHDAVPAGKLDRLVYDDLLEEAPALGSMVSQLRKTYAHTDDLVRDVLMSFYQHKPEVRGREEMDPSRLHNWAVAQGIAESPDTAQAREYTRHDKYAAAMMTIGATSKVQALLEANKAVQEAAEEVEQAQQGLKRAVQQVKDAAQDASAAEEALGESAGDEQAACDAKAACEAATTRLQLALSTAENAQERVEATEFTAQQAAAQALTKLQAPIGEAVAEGVAELKQEQELAAAWGQSDGQMRAMPFAERQAALQLMKDSAVSRYAQLLGRFQYAERSLRAKRVVPGRDEVYAVTRSARLEDVLASEFVSLVVPELEPEFLDRWSNAQLLSREYRGTEKQGKGAIVMCVDTSDSMNWKTGGPVTPAVWSKAFLLALLQRARHDKRDFVVLLFSSRNQVEVHRFPKGQATLEQTIAVVTRAFNGGTAFEPPIDTAMEILDEEFNRDGTMRGDMLFITDDDCAVQPEWLEAYRERKQMLGFRTWGIAVPTTKVGSTLAALSDNARGVATFVSPEPVVDLLKAI